MREHVSLIQIRSVNNVTGVCTSKVWRTFENFLFSRMILDRYEMNFSLYGETTENSYFKSDFQRGFISHGKIFFL